MVTGSSGYIGANLVNYLRDKDFEVVEYDIKDRMDILDLDCLTKEMAGCNYVYNCAAISGVKACEKDRQLALKVNIFGAFNVVTTANTFGAKPILFSSQAIYGDSYYGLLKRTIETLFENIAVILRLSNVFGGFGFIKKKNTVVKRFCVDNPIKVYGGEQTRDFIYIDNVLSICLAAQEFSSGIHDVKSGYEIPIKTLALLFQTGRKVPIKWLPARENK